MAIWHQGFRKYVKDDPFIEYATQKPLPKKVIDNIKAFGVEKYKKLAFHLKYNVREGTHRFFSKTYGYPGKTLEPHLKEIKKLWLEGNTVEQIFEINPKKFQSEPTIAKAVNSMKGGEAPIKITDAEVKNRVTIVKAVQLRDNKKVKDAYDTLLKDYKKRGLDIRPSKAELVRQTNLSGPVVGRVIAAQNIDVQNRSRTPEQIEASIKEYRKALEEKRLRLKELKPVYKGRGSKLGETPKVVDLAGPEKLKQEYLEDYKKRLKYPAAGRAYRAAVERGEILGNPQLAKKYGLSHESTVQQINAYLIKKEKLKYTKGVPGSGQELRKSRLSITQPGTRIHGKGRFHQFHHIMPIGGETALTTKDVAFVTKKMNSAMQGYNNILNRIADGISDNLNKSVPDLKRIDELNNQAAQVVDKAKNELPKKFRGLVGFNKIIPITDEYGTLINTSVERIGIKEAKTPGGVKGPSIPLSQMKSGTYSPIKFLKAALGLAKTNAGGVCNIPSVVGAKAEGGRIGFAAGSNCARQMEVAFNKDPIKVTQEISALPANKTLNTVKTAAGGFLKMLGRGGLKAAPLAALAVAGAAAEPLVKFFRNDDPSTYLTDESQMKGMLLATIEGETPKVDEEILKYTIPTLGAATAAGAIPGAKTAFQERRGVGARGPLPGGVGKTRAALGLRGVAGKALGATFSPLAVAATLPLGIAAQRKAGTEWGDIATDPMNWMGPAFASTGAEMATRGIKNPLLLKALRMGMSPRTLSLVARRFGLPGLAISAGMWGYDKWKNRSINDE